jgi:uncharacterized protein (TIGR02147 family)
MSPSPPDSQPKEPPNIYTFVDYRAFLSAILAHFKMTKRSFSLRNFAATAGFGSHSYLRMVIKGDRNLTPSSLIKICRALKLNSKAARYFETLVFYNQAASESDKDRYFSDLLTIRPNIKLKGIEKDQFEYVTNSLFVTIREMAALPNFRDDIDWISQRLMRPALPSQIRHALDVLKRLQLLVEGPGASLTHSGKALQTPPRIESLQIFNAHRNILSESKDLILQTPHEQTEITSMTVPVAPKTLGRIFELVQKCREEIIAAINNGSQDFENVFQINIQVLPVTKTLHNTDDPAGDL